MVLPIGKNLYSITPGTMGSLSVIIKLIGLENIANPEASWGRPVMVFSTPEEIDSLMDLLREAGPMFDWNCIRLTDVRS